MRPLNRIRVGIVIVSACLLASSARAAADDYWSGWRARQRAELAGLPKPPDPPAGAGNPIDRFLAAHWAKHRITVPAVVDDAMFVRRVYLDVIGLLPTPEQLEQFQQDGRADKRARLVDQLLADRQEYAEHWMTLWNDLLRNDEQTSIDGLRQPITRWLYQSLLANKPLDVFVAELLYPNREERCLSFKAAIALLTIRPPDLFIPEVIAGRYGSDGYLMGVNWRGRVNASQTPPIQAAQNISQVFLANSLKCASCHDSFINEWKLKQAYGLASFFSASNLEMHRCDKATGKVVGPEFLFPGLGEVAAEANLETRRRAVAEMVTRPKNPRFARTLVNRLWQRLLGRGLFEPVDDFDSSPPNSALLDWLADDLMRHDYDAKHTLRLILTSRVYQLPVARQAPGKKGKEGKEGDPIRGPVERRLTSEQYLDAIAQVTGYWPKADVMQVQVAGPHVRAWRHKKPDALVIALGRPNREQVCTERNQDSTVLQALELVNGVSLAGRVQQGAKRLLASDLGKQKSDQAADMLYRRTLGRLPTDAERRLIRPLLGNPGDNPRDRQAGWEDLLWVLFQSTEFQFVR